jgi:hypothetical protein
MWRHARTLHAPAENLGYVEVLLFDGLVPSEVTKVIYPRGMTPCQEVVTMLPPNVTAVCDGTHPAA